MYPSLILFAGMKPGKSCTKLDLCNKLVGEVEKYKLHQHLYGLGNLDDEEDTDDDSGQDGLNPTASESKPGDYYRLVNALCHERVKHMYANLGTHTSRASHDNDDSPLDHFKKLLHEVYHDPNKGIELDIFQHEHEQFDAMPEKPFPGDYGKKTVDQLNDMRRSLEQQYNKIDAETTVSGNHKSFEDCASGNPKVLYFYLSLQEEGDVLKSVQVALSDTVFRQSTKKTNKKGNSQNAKTPKDGKGSKKGGDEHLETLALASATRTSILQKSHNQNEYHQALKQHDEHWNELKKAKKDIGESQDTLGSQDSLLIEAKEHYEAAKKSYKLAKDKVKKLEQELQM